MSLVTLLFFSWLAFMVFRGWFRGFWALLGSFLSLVVAYALAIMLAPSLAPTIESWGIPSRASLPVAATVIWMVSGLLFSVFYKLSTLSLKRREGSWGRFGGAALGLMFGTLSGLIAVWGFGFVRDLAASTMENAYGRGNPTAAAFSQRSKVEDVAANFVSTTTRMGMSAAGASKVSQDLAGAIMRAPGEMLQSAKALAHHPALQNLMQDTDAVAAMRARDPEGLQQTAAFKELMAAPEAQSLLSRLTGETSDSAAGADILQDKLADMSIRVQSVRDNPEAIAMAQDPEVMAVVEEANPWKMLSHPKIQRLLAFLSDDSAVTETGTEAKAIGTTDTAVYRWTDDAGRVHYTDYQHVPFNKRESAQKIMD
jgi:uncharacterized membrane protein required for colicin V production